MSYKKRQDGRYAAQIRTGELRDGKPVRKTIYARTQRELSEKIRQAKNSIEAGADLSLESMTMDTLIDRYLASKELTVRPQTLRVMKARIKWIRSRLGAETVRKVSSVHVEAFRVYLMENTTPTCTNSVLGELRAVMKYAVKMGVIVRNPATAVDHVKEQKPQKRALTPEEYRKIQKADLDPESRCLIDMLLSTGMRRGELIALMVDDIDLDRGFIRVSKTWTPNGIQQMTKTEHGNRLIPILPELRPTLEYYLPVVGDGFMFRNRAGAPMSGVVLENTVHRILKQIFNGNPPADLTPHLFRHNFASMLVSGGVNIKTAQMILGHKDIKTTLDTYTHFGYEDYDLDRVLKIGQSKSSQMRKVASGKR